MTNIEYWVSRYLTIDNKRGEFLAATQPALYLARLGILNT